MIAIKERTASILSQLAEAESFLPLGELAGRLGVSAKTVARDLPEAEEFLSLEGEGACLEMKKGAGLRLRGSHEARARLLEKLGKVKNHSYTPEERLSIIVSRLLPEKEPVKLFYLSSLLGVTDSTVSSDLDKLEGWFKGHGLKLVRKPGLGVYVAGEERKIRQAIIAYIYDHVTEAELLALVQANLQEEKGPEPGRAARYLLDLVDKEIIHSLEVVIRRAERQMERRLSDQAFIGILVHLALAVQRLRKGENIKLQPEYLERLKQKQEFSVASRMGEEISREFGLTVTEDEAGYIAMHLLGARSRYREESLSGTVLDNFHLVRLAKSIMKAAEERSGEPLYRDGELLAGLVNHLGPSISRMELKMDIRNPLLGEMKEKFPELMALAKGSVREAERELELTFPESELAYIAMHLSAALMGTDLLTRASARVIVACPTGMGTSRLLAGQLKKYYAENLVIAEQMAALELSSEFMASARPDFIISTVPIPQVQVPVVVVGALLSEEDRQRIDGAIRSLSVSRVEEKAARKVKLDFVSALRVLSAYEGAILTLLDSFFFLNLPEAMTVQEAAAAIGRQAGRTAEAAKGIEGALLAREDQGSTAIAGGHMIMLHCRSPFVQGLQLGIVRLGEYFLYPAEPREKIRTAIVLLAPRDCSCYELETIGHISSILLERWGLLDMLHEGSQVHIKAELVRIFREFYEAKHRDLMED